MKTIILASKSPRRLEILNKHGINPIVMPSDVQEIVPDSANMVEAVKSIASQKGVSVYDMVKNQPEYSDSIVLAADTIVFKNKIMGKPKDYDDAFKMLDSIRNTSHYVATGIYIKDVATGKETILCDVTTVHCHDYSDEDIRTYIEEEQPYDKAGSYAIQGGFGKHIRSITGSYENVMGLPFHCIEPFLK